LNVIVHLVGFICEERQKSAVTDTDQSQFAVHLPECRLSSRISTKHWIKYNHSNV